MSLFIESRLGRWILTHAGDKRVRALADRHYPTRAPKASSTRARTVGPPGERLVFVTEDGKAGWITLRQKPEATDHEYPGAWVCSMFRNEGSALSSELVREAVELTVERWGPLTREGFISFVDAKKTAGRRSRSALPGHCFRCAGWREIGRSGARTWARNTDGRS
jgi:hypothetical protein